MKHRTFMRFCAVLAAALVILPAAAQEIDPRSPAFYDGADRASRIEQAAKHEGAITLYTTLAEKNLQALVGPFERKYGIKVQVWRAGQSRVLQRLLTEGVAGRHEVDVIHMGSPELEALHRAGLLQTVRSPVLMELSEGSVPKHRQWAATILQVYVQAYNTGRIRKEDLPRSFEDLLHPRWKGSLGIEAKAWPWYAGVLRSMGEEKGRRLFAEIVARNGMSVRHGTSLLNNMVVAGEVPLALTVYSHMPHAAREKGASIDWFAIKPTIARANGIAVASGAPHPNAAILFYDYMLSADGAQKAFAEMDYVPTNTRLASSLPDLKFTLIEPQVVLEDADKWMKEFDETFVKR